jgi:hypothetical protein
MRPLKKALFCPILALGSNFNPRNTNCMSVVKILACLGLEQNQTFFKGLIIKISAHPKMADFGSVQGRSNL